MKDSWTVSMLLCSIASSLGAWLSRLLSYLSPIPLSSQLISISFVWIGLAIVFLVLGIISLVLRR